MKDKERVVVFTARDKNNKQTVFDSQRDSQLKTKIEEVSFLNSHHTRSRGKNGGMDDTSVKYKLALPLHAMLH